MITRTRVRFMKLDKAASVPTYGSEQAAGADLYACTGETLTVQPGQTAFVKTGIAMEIPEGLVGFIYARSGLACKKGLAPANKVGVIDSDYRGEIMVALHNHSGEPVEVEHGERVAQMVIAPYVYAEYEEVVSLESTERGAGGFGSTGRNQSKNTHIEPTSQKVEYTSTDWEVGFLIYVIHVIYSTVTDFAKFLGWSTLSPRSLATK